MKNLKMHRIAFAGVLFFIIIAIFTLTACSPRGAKYNGKEVIAIQTVCSEGLAPFPREFVRTFDFQRGTVSDTWKADEEYLDKDNRNQYNNPKEIATFTQEQGQALIDEMGALGFFDWKERYVTDETVNDGAGSYVKVRFADGTAKTTYIYFMNPPNYSEIKAVIESTLGVTMYLQF